MENSSTTLDRFSNWFISLIYSKEKRYQRILIVLLIVGFFLRLLAALNLDVFADDMVYVEQSANIWHAKILSTNSHPPLFYYLTDLAFKVFGYTTFASRFFSLVAGTLLIAVVFLITKKLWNEKIALYAAFLATFANFLIKLTVGEQSNLIFFFAFFGIYVGMLYLESKKISYLIFAAVLFGLANLSKYNGFFFLAGFFLFALYHFYHKKEKIFSKQHIKHGIIALIIILLLALPFLAFNYLIYKEKGFLDFQFAKITQSPTALELYKGLGGIDASLSDGLTRPSNYSNYLLVYKTDLLLFVLGLLGTALLLYKREKIPLAFLVCFLLIPFVLQSGSSTLAKHFAFMHIVLTIPGAYVLNQILSKINRRSIKLAVIAVLALILLANLGNHTIAASNYLSPSAVSQLKSYINHNVQPGDLIVMDARIYTGQAFWLATDHNMLNPFQFVEFYNYHNQVPAQQKQTTTVYLVECATDDCGWGNIASINQSSESFFVSIANASDSPATISTKIYEGNEFYGPKHSETRYNIYKLQLQLNPQLVESTKSMNSFYYAPYLYLNMKEFVYNYDASGFEKPLDFIAHMVLYLAVILAIIAFIILFFFL